jgi:hypothetical protein
MPGIVSDCWHLAHKRKLWFAKYESTIVAAFAGLIAQRTFHPQRSTNGASDDENLVHLLVKEMYPDELIREARRTDGDFRNSRPIEKEPRPSASNNGFDHCVSNKIL